MDQLDVYAAAYRRSFKRLDNVVRRQGIDRRLLDEWRRVAQGLRALAAAEGWTPERYGHNIDALAEFVRAGKPIRNAEWNASDSGHAEHKKRVAADDAARAAYEAASAEIRNVQ